MPRFLLCAALSCAAHATIAQPATSDVPRLASIAREAARIGAQHGESIWPGFRPDTIPLAFVLPSRGTLLFGWRASPPSGFASVGSLPNALWREQRDLGAASTSTMLEGRRVAQVVIGGESEAELVATAIHEAFHVLQAASARAGARFGRGENAMLVSTYPVFDADNEGAFALEGRILAAALDATSRTAKRDLARQFVAVRRERHRDVPSEFAEFDMLSELNEGLAEYALVRALQVELREGPRAWRDGARRALDARRALLSDLTRTDNLSLRFRYYQTGPAQALLLDALAGPSWKSDMLTTGATLQDMLARASGVDDVARSAYRTAVARFDALALRASASRQIDALKRARRAKADSVLSTSGLKLALVADSLPGRRFNPCGYDPQNVLQVSATVEIHMRWWRPCAGGPTNAEFNVPSVFDQGAGSIRAVIGGASEVKLTSNGQALTLEEGVTLRNVRAFKLHAPRASVSAARAEVTMLAGTLTIRPMLP